MGYGWLKEYTSLLRLPSGRLLAAGGMTGRSGFVGGLLATIIFAEEQYGNFASAGAVAASMSLGIAVGRLAQAKASERIEPRRILRFAAAVYLISLIAFIAAGARQVDLPFFVVLAGVTGVVSPAIAPLARLLWSRVGEPHQRSAYHRLEQIITEGSYMIGSLVGGVTSTIANPALAIGVMGALYSTGALIMSFSRSSRRASVAESGAYGHFLVRLAPVAGIFFIGGIGGGIVEISVPAFAVNQDALSAVGPLLFTWGAGSVVGGMIQGRWVTRGRLPNVLAGGALALSLTIIPAALAESVLVLGVILFVHGMAVVPTWGSAFALAEKRMGEARRSQMFALLYLASSLGTAAGTAGGGILVARSSTAVPVLCAAIAYGLLGLLVALFGQRLIRLPRVVATRPG